MTPSPVVRYLARYVALLYVGILVIVPVGLILWRTFEPGIGAFFEPRLKHRFGVQEDRHVLIDSLAQLEELISMGVLEGTREAMSQIDFVLADLAEFAAGRAAEAQILSDTQVRVGRIIRGTIDQVWRAHHDPELMKRWLLGPDGWIMPVCEIASEVGDSYRYMWEPVAGGEGFGFTGELLESEEPYRAVTTEAMIGMDFPATLNELTLTPVQGGTLLSIVITYANAEMRDAVLATGMTDGMETSYSRLEELLEASVDA